MSWDRTTTEESFSTRIERLQGSRTVLGLNDSRGVLLSRDETTPGESFCPGMERLHWSHYILRLNDSRGVIPPKGQKDSRGVILS